MNLKTIPELYRYLEECLNDEGDPNISNEQSADFARAYSERLRTPGEYTIEEFVASHGLSMAAAKPIILACVARLLPSFFPERDKIPGAMRQMQRWVGYQFEDAGDKWKKPPHSPIDGSSIGGVKEYIKHFLNFDGAITRAKRLGLDGVGFVLLEEDNIVCIDVDHAFEDGVIHPEVKNWLRLFSNTYAEFSPTGTGIHIWCRGKLAKAVGGLPLPGTEGVMVEAYSQGRYITVTGFTMGHPSEISDCQLVLDKLLDHLGTKNAPVASNDKGMTRDHAQKVYARYLAELRAAKEGTRNNCLNKVAYFAACAHAGQLLDKDERTIKKEISEAAEAAWVGEVPDGDLNTAISAWNDGLDNPITCLESDGILWEPGRMDKAVRQAEDVLFKLGSKYFESDGRLVTPRLARDTDKRDLLKADQNVQRDQSSAILVDASHETITRDLDEHGNFIKFVEKKGKPEPVKIYPPTMISNHILDRTMNAPNEIPFPRLSMLVNTPVLLPSGEVHDAPGELHEGILFLDRHYKYSRVPERPSQDDARAALQRFDPIFCRFPFVKENDDPHWQKTPSYAVVLAACLTIVARSALQVAVPLFAIKAPKQRSGKTKIADASTRAMTGHKATTIHYRDEEEFGKTLLPLLLHQDRVVLVDNIDRPFRSAKFAPLVTDNSLTDRWLGRSESVKLYNRAVFFATGNNLVITGDLGWRTLLVSIDANMEHPEDRQFSFKPEERALTAHPELVIAALTALRAYILAKKPWQLSRSKWGGFEEWDALISGCLTWLGYADPKLTQETVIEDDPVREANVRLLETWYSEFGDASVQLSSIERNAASSTRYELQNAKGEWDAKEVGYRLRGLRDRVESGYKLVKGKGTGGSSRYYWRVTSIEEKPKGKLLF